MRATLLQCTCASRPSTGTTETGLDALFDFVSLESARLRESSTLKIVVFPAFFIALNACSNKFRWRFCKRSRNRSCQIATLFLDLLHVYGLSLYGSSKLIFGLTQEVKSDGLPGGTPEGD